MPVKTRRKKTERPSDPSEKPPRTSDEKVPAPQFSKVQVARDYCRRFPKSGHSALARKIKAENPALFATVDAAYQCVRNARGKHGALNRHQSADKQAHETHKRSMSPWHGLPDGRVQLPDWKIIQHDEPGWWLVLGDIHIPWHDKSAVELFIREAKRRNVVGILLNGDIVDAHECSDHERDPRVRVFKEEILTVRTFLETLRKEFPKAQIVWKLGNHEERYSRFMQRRAPELLDLDDFQWGAMCRVEDHGVELIGDCQPVALGRLVTVHGHEYRFAISNPVSPSRGLFLRAGVSAVCNHFHRSSQFSKRDLIGHVVSTWSVGCLCDLKPKWLPVNDWNLGGAFVRVAQDGAYDVNNLRVIDGQLWA